MDDYQLEQFERINEDMRNEGISDDVLEQSRLLKSLSTARGLVPLCWKEMPEMLSQSLPEWRTREVVYLDDAELSRLGIKGLKFVDSDIYVLKNDGKQVKAEQLQLEKLSTLVTAVENAKSRSRENDVSSEHIMALYSHLHNGYRFASPTTEIIGGNLAKDFEGVARFWSRALDFTVSGIPEFKGIRYIDLKDRRDLYLLFNNGDSKSLEDMSKVELALIKISFDSHLKVLKKRKNAVMDYKRFEKSGKGKVNGVKIK